MTQAKSISSPFSSPAESQAIDQLHGVNPAAVIAAITERAKQWRSGQHQANGRKLGLVIEGGAMRGVCSAGGIVALSHLRYNDLFDEIYATSAGAVNASYMLADQAELGITIYFEDLIGSRFVNPKRFWKILDVDMVFDSIIPIRKPLNVKKILASRTRLFVMVTDMISGEGRLIDTHNTPTPLLQVLKASTAFPVLYNRRVEVEGRPCIDGGIRDKIPLDRAIANGCTDLLVLLTRPAEFKSPKPSRAFRWLFDIVCARGNAKTRHAFQQHNLREISLRKLALGHVPTPPGVNIATICPDQPEIVHRTTRDPVLLRQAAIDFGRKVLRAFGADPEAWDLAPLKSR